MPGILVTARGFRERFDVRARYGIRLIFAPFISGLWGPCPFIGCGPPTLPTKIEAGRYRIMCKHIHLTGVHPMLRATCLAY
jgi:hypothetical protein